MKELFGDSHDSAIDRFRSPYVFRGLPMDFSLQPSLHRLGYADTGDLQFIERRLLESFQKYAHGQFDPSASIWHWISLAQHHGLPTRLLDWSYSPFVALHFATSDIRAMEHDAVVWCVHRWAIQRWLPDDLRESITRARAGVFPIEVLAKEFPTFQKFDDPDAGNDFMIFFEPPSLDARIVNQGALFSFASRATLDLRDWLERVNGQSSDAVPLCKRVVVAKALKWEVRDYLDQANVQERVLFPGLDGLSAWLRRWYTRKMPAVPLPGAPGVPGDTPRQPGRESPA
jgi:hypothetical protein